AVRGAVPGPEPDDHEAGAQRRDQHDGMAGLPGRRTGPGTAAVAGGRAPLPQGKTRDLRLTRGRYIRPMRKRSHVSFEPTRRQYVHGRAAGGMVAGFGLWPGSGRAAGPVAGPNVLTGTEFDLAIGEAPANFTGLTRPAIMVNGSIPAPL